MIPLSFLSHFLTKCIRVEKRRRTVLYYGVHLTIIPPVAEDEVNIADNIHRA